MGYRQKLLGFPGFSPKSSTARRAGIAHLAGFAEPSCRVECENPLRFAPLTQLCALLARKEQWGNKTWGVVGKKSRRFF